MSTKRENYERRKTRNKGNNRNENRKIPQYCKADIFCAVICFDKFIVFMFLGIKNPYQRRTQNTFVDHFIQPVDYLLCFTKEYFDLSEYYKKCPSDNRDNKQYRQTKLPIGNKQEYTRADYQTN